MDNAPQRKPTAEMLDILRERARQMRQNPTSAEEKLWQALRRKNLENIRFRRQHIIYHFIVDFYCPKANLIIELDGSSHDDKMESDELRTDILRNLGFEIVRFDNIDVIKNLDAVLDNISEKLIHILSLKENI